MVSRLIEVRQVGKRVLTLVLTEALEIGRECDGVLIGDVKASRRHAMLTPEREGVVVEDLGSSNGTFVNGERIAAPALVVPGDEVTIADTVVVVLDRDEQIVGSSDLVAHTSDDSSTIAGSPTILVSDIEGSGSLAAHLGDQSWRELLEQHDAIVRDCLAANGSVDSTSVSRTAGVGFTATFASPLDGLNAAVAIQRAIAARTREGGWPIRVRIGLDSGDAGAELAERLAGRAAGGQVLISGALHDLVGPDTNVGLSPARELELDGLAGTHTVHAVDWQSAA